MNYPRGGRGLPGCLHMKVCALATMHVLQTSSVVLPAPLDPCKTLPVQPTAIPLEIWHPSRLSSLLGSRCQEQRRQTNLALPKYSLSRTRSASGRFARSFGGLPASTRCPHQSAYGSSSHDYKTGFSRDDLSLPLAGRAAHGVLQEKLGTL